MTHSYLDIQRYRKPLEQVLVPVVEQRERHQNVCKIPRLQPLVINPRRAIHRAPSYLPPDLIHQPLVPKLHLRGIVRDLAQVMLMEVTCPIQVDYQRRKDLQGLLVGELQLPQSYPHVAKVPRFEVVPLVPQLLAHPSEPILVGVCVELRAAVQRSNDVLAREPLPVFFNRGLDFFQRVEVLEDDIERHAKEPLVE